MLFPIDHGNSAMKTVNFVFPSGLIDNPIRPPVDTEMLEYDGKFWTLSGQRISYMRDKTKDERYWILTLFAIAKELEKSGNTSPMVEADLAVGLPPEHYALRQRFADYFKRGRVNFVYNGAPICLLIRHVFVYPQAYAAVVPQAGRLKEIPRTFIIDIGGYTTDVMLLRNAAPDLQFCRSLEMGVIPMSNDIISRVSAMYDIREGRTRGSRMLCADELWRLGGHDPYSLIMIRRFGRDPSGSYSVAGCGKCQKLGE